MIVERFLQFFHIYRNVRDTEVGLIYKLHNNIQLVTSHCIMSLKSMMARTRNLIEKLGKVAHNVLCGNVQIERSR